MLFCPDSVLEVRDQSVSRVERVSSEASLLGLSRAAASQGLPVCLCVLLPSFCHIIRSGLTQRTSFQLNHPSESLISNYSHSLEYGGGEGWAESGLGLQCMNLGATQWTPKQHPSTNQKGFIILRVVTATSFTTNRRSQPC